MKVNDTNSNDTQTIKMEMSYDYVRGLNVLGLLSFCLAFALAVNRGGEQAQIVHEFFVAVNSAVGMMIEWIIQ